MVRKCKSELKLRFADSCINGESYIVFWFESIYSTSATSAKLLANERGFTPRGHNPFGPGAGHHPEKLQTLNHVTDATNGPLFPSFDSVKKLRLRVQDINVFPAPGFRYSWSWLYPLRVGFTFLLRGNGKQTESRDLLLTRPPTPWSIHTCLALVNQMDPFPA